MANHERDDWDNGDGRAVESLLLRRSNSFHTPGQRLDIEGSSLPPLGRAGSNRRTRPSSPPRFSPRRFKIQR